MPFNNKGRYEERNKQWTNTEEKNNERKMCSNERCAKLVIKIKISKLKK